VPESGGHWFGERELMGGELRLRREREVEERRRDGVVDPACARLGANGLVALKRALPAVWWAEAGRWELRKMDRFETRSGEAATWCFDSSVAPTRY